MTPPPLRFGVSVLPSPVGGRDPVADAVHAESLGFDLVTVWDHLNHEAPSVETWTLLTWIAARTERILVAPIVLGLPYRHPAVVAKMAEGLDRLSHGRLILGLGGGGSDREFGGYGLDVRPPGGKVSALDEAVTIVRRLWEEESFTFEGDHFRTHEARLEPKPERPIPIWLGSYGDRALRLLARSADGWIPSMPYLPPESAAAKWGAIRRAAEDAGRDPDGIVWAYNVTVQLGREPDRPNTLGGSPEAVAERVAELARLGVRFPIFWPRGDAREQREVLAREVIPAIRRETGEG